MKIAVMPKAPLIRRDGENASKMIQCHIDRSGLFGRSTRIMLPIFKIIAVDSTIMPARSKYPLMKRVKLEKDNCKLWPVMFERTIP